MAFMQIPDFLNEIVPSLILIASIFTFFSLASTSEITIMRSAGLSLWSIIKPIGLTSFALGIFWAIIFSPISTLMIKKFNNLEGKYVRHEMREVVAPKSGIWLKQDNISKIGETIIIKASKVYQENLELHLVSLWFYDKNNVFYKKIDAKKMFMKEGIWILEEVVINEQNELNSKADSISIPTNLEASFIMKKIVNNFQNVKLFSFFELPRLIKDLRQSGFDSTKFNVYFHSLINKPVLFMAMSIIACYFGLNHIRNNNAFLMIFLGIIFGLVIYVIASIMTALGSSGIISVFASTWLITVICLAIGVLLTYKKENI
jgi:lipopolysaccharide export system permease protein